MNIRFDNQVVVITGAAGSLGRAYALDVARRGGAVVANDLGGDYHGRGSSRAVDKVVDEIRAAGGTAIANHDSVAEESGGEALCQAALNAFGKVDALINNAGNLRIAPFEEVTADDVNSLLSVHVAGAFNVTRPIYRHMKARGYGRILFTTSGAAFGNPAQAAYGAAKGGIIGLMHAVAAEGVAHGILSNGILPAAATRMVEALLPAQLAEVGANTVPFQAELQPENVAPLATYLISKQCQSNHCMYSAVGNRFARVFLGVSQGWLAGRGVVPTAEDIAARFECICDTRQFDVPANMVDEYKLISAAIARE